jgi:hypothetical protein
MEPPCIPPPIGEIFQQGWTVLVGVVEIHFSHDDDVLTLRSHLSELNCDIVTQYRTDGDQDLCFDRFARVHITVRKLRLLNVFKKDDEIYDPNRIYIFNNGHVCKYIRFHTSHEYQFVQHWSKSSFMTRPNREKHTENFEEFVRDMTPKK